MIEYDETGDDVVHCGAGTDADGRDLDDGGDA